MHECRLAHGPTRHREEKGEKFLFYLFLKGGGGGGGESI